MRFDTTSNASNREDLPEPFEPISSTNLAVDGIPVTFRWVNRLKFSSCTSVILIPKQFSGKGHK